MLISNMYLVFFRGNSQIRYSKQNWARRTALFPEETWMWIMWKILIFLFLPDFIIIYLYIMHVKVLSQKSHLKFHEFFVICHQMFFLWWESQLQIYFLCEKCVSQFQVLEFFRDIWKDISELLIKRNRTSPAMNVANHLVNHIICVAFLELKKIVFSKKNSKYIFWDQFSIQFFMLISNMYLVFSIMPRTIKFIF